MRGGLRTPRRDRADRRRPRLRRRGPGSPPARTGTAYLFSGAATGEQDVDDALTALRGIVDDGAFGTRVTEGDVTGDGVADLLVASPVSDAVHVFPGPIAPGDGTADAAVRIGGADDEAIAFGAALLMFDGNGDGIDDLAASAPYVDDGTLPDCGAVFVVFGPLGADMTLDDADRQHRGTNSDRLVAAGTVTLGGQTEIVSPLFGIPRASLGDVNGDGRDDLGIGVPDGLSSAVFVVLGRGY